METEKVNSVLISITSGKLSERCRKELVFEFLHISNLFQNSRVGTGFIKDLPKPIEIGTGYSVEETEEKGWFGRVKKVQEKRWHVWLKFDREMVRGGEEHRLWTMFGVGHMTARITYHKWVSW